MNKIAIARKAPARKGEGIGTNGFIAAALSLAWHSESTKSCSRTQLVARYLEGSYGIVLLCTYFLTDGA